MRALVLAAAITAWPLASQTAVPSFTADSILPANARTRAPLKPGMIVSIYGRHLGPSVACTAPRHEGLSGVRELCSTFVTVNGVRAGLLYVHSDQVNLVVPNNVPSEGSLPLIVSHQGIASKAILLLFDVHPARIALAGRAQVHGPIWIDVRLPGRMQTLVRYPIAIQPNELGGHRFEVRKDGRALALTPARRAPMAGGGATGSIGGGRLLGLPRPPAKTGRLPLHLVYRLDIPGRYQVRYAGYDVAFPNAEKALVRSPWITINVEPGRHASSLPSAPSDPVDLLSDYLPSLLAVRDQKSLARIEDALYHPDRLVRQYAMYSLYLFEDKLVAKWMPKVLQRRGPTDDLAYFVSWRSDLFRPAFPEIADAVVPYLRSASPSLVAGALRTLIFLRPHATRDTAVLDAAPSLLGRRSPEVAQPLAEFLGGIKSDRSRELLWRMVEEGAAREQSLIALTWIADKRDLPRLIKLRFPDFDYHLKRAYGDAALAHLTQ